MEGKTPNFFTVTFLINFHKKFLYIKGVCETENSKRSLRLNNPMEYQEKSAIDKDGKKVTWRHPGGKLRRLGPQALTDKELLAVILGSGSSGRTAEEIADEIIYKHYSLQGLMGKSISELMAVKGLKEVKATQIAAVFEVARRIVKALEKE